MSCVFSPSQVNYRQAFFSQAELGFVRHRIFLREYPTTGVTDDARHARQRNENARDWERAHKKMISSNLRRGWQAPGLPVLINDFFKFWLNSIHLLIIQSEEKKEDCRISHFFFLPPHKSICDKSGVVIFLTPRISAAPAAHPCRPG